MSMHITMAECFSCSLLLKDPSLKEVEQHMKDSGHRLSVIYSLEHESICEICYEVIISRSRNKRMHERCGAKRRHGKWRMKKAQEENKK